MLKYKTFKGKESTAKRQEEVYCRKYCGGKRPNKMFIRRIQMFSNIVKHQLEYIDSKILESEEKLCGSLIVKLMYLRRFLFNPSNAGFFLRRQRLGGVDSTANLATSRSGISMH